MTKALTPSTNTQNHNKNTTKMTNVNMNPPRRVKFGELLHSSDPNLLSPLLPDDDQFDINNLSSSSSRHSNASDQFTTTSSSPRMSFCNDEMNQNASPYNNNYGAMSPWSQTASPYVNSPWIKLSPLPSSTPNHHHHHRSQSSRVYFSRGRNCLIGSLVREEGHVYSLAVRAGALYTGSESKNIRVWRDFHDSGGFKCGSGLVKAIVVSTKDNRVFTGHQDGKIRVWSEKGKRVGTLPKLSHLLKSSIDPKGYVEVRRHHKVPRIKHYDAVSCLSFNESSGLLYSGSWDKSVKVWRVSDGRCLESIDAHDDAINSIVVGFDGLVFSGSADGTVKVWKKELQGRSTRHFLVRTLLKQENAVTSLAVSDTSSEGDVVLYCGSSDGLVNFWEKEKEELVYGGVLRGHKLAVLCVATAGCLVLSGSTDKTICVWRREGQFGAHSCLSVLSGHCGPVKCLAVELDLDDHGHDDDQYDGDDDQGRQWIVYSGSLDKSVRIWRVSEHAPED